MTGAGSVFNYLKPQKGSSIIIFGVGTVGLSAIMIASKICGCSKIIAVDKNLKKLNMAGELGATHLIPVKSMKETQNLEKKIVEIMNSPNPISVGLTGSLTTQTSDLIDFALDTTGNNKLLSVLESPKVFSATGKGCSVIYGKFKLKEKQEWEQTDEGFAVAREFIPKLIEFYKDGHFPFEKLIEFYDFEQIQEAFDDFENGNCIKPVIILQEIV